ncbi:M48 family metallopeptidase [Endothiovibrio diazotrophicus]
MAGLLYLCLSACAVNPVTHRSQLMLIPEDLVVARSYASYANLISSEGASNRLNSDEAGVSRIRDITFRIIPQTIQFRPETADWDWEVNLIDSDQVNAFCMAGGKIAVYSGLIDRLQPTDDELAQVIAHEIAHALSNHSQEKLSIALAGGALGAAILSSNAGRKGRLNAAMVDTAIQVALTLPNSRQAESEADQIGIKLAAMAGYDPAAGASLWRKMAQVAGAGPVELLSTHPSPENREEALRQAAVELKEVYAQAKGNRESRTTAPAKLESRRASRNQGPDARLYGNAVYTEPKQEK